MANESKDFMRIYLGAEFPPDIVQNALEKSLLCEFIFWPIKFLKVDKIQFLENACLLDSLSTSYKQKTAPGVV